MLKQRIITAIILIPAVLGLLYYLTPLAFCIVTAVFFLAAAFEWTALMQLKTLQLRLLYLVLMAAVMYISARFISTPIILLAGFCWWLVALIMVSRYARGITHSSGGAVSKGFMGVMVLVPCWIALNYIRADNQGVITIVYLFVLIWGADTTAYFVGKKWGKTKLAPQVSPGKSIQGALGAVVFAIVFTVIAALASHSPFVILLCAVALAVITVLFSIQGDLFESMLKRQANLKDSGNILPGHGGLLDRIDSLTAAVPVYAYGCLQLSIYFS